MKRVLSVLFLLSLSLLSLNASALERCDARPQPKRDTDWLFGRQCYAGKGLFFGKGSGTGATSSLDVDGIFYWPLDLLRGQSPIVARLGVGARRICQNTIQEIGGSLIGECQMMFPDHNCVVTRAQILESDKGVCTVAVYVRAQ